MDSTNSARPDLKQWLPFLWLFRTFRIALDVRKMLLGAIGIFLVVVGNRALDRLELVDAPRTQRLVIVPGQGTIPRGGEQNVIIGGRFEAALHPFSPKNALFSPVFEGAVEPTIRLIALDTPFAGRIDALCRWLWFLLIGGLIGGAITRMAIVEFVKDERLGLRPAVAFSSRRLHHFLTAPLLPFGGCVVLLLLCAIGGLFLRIPGVGGWIVSILWFIPLILSIGTAILLIGLLAGWPLMVSALSTEDSDGFDAFSRAHSYVYDRPWQYLGYVLIAAVYAALTAIFVDFVGQSVAELSLLGVSFGAGGSIDELLNTGTGPAAVYDWWMKVVRALILGFRVSFFWVACLIIYLLLRKAVDNTPLKEAFLDPVAPDQQRAVALSGLAGVQEVIVERQVVPPDQENGANPPA